jgi:hypothetical protein
MSKFLQSRAAKGALVVGASLLAGSAFADSAAAVTAISSAQTDALAVAGAITAMLVAIWGAMFIAKKFFGRG